MRKKFLSLFVIILFMVSKKVCYSQTAYFVDGFHGGVWGHYPNGYTSFIVDQLDKNPQWDINLEIEPETWDREAMQDEGAYLKLKNLLQTQPSNGRIEYVNPAYAQSYTFNVSGESNIRQFAYGIKKLRAHFPDIQFNTYSSEEPCFTSALPQILKSFGFKYASLKNPNTCWGGYTRAFGGELVNWIGPDGTGILTVPRYEIESLKGNSTWETIANENSPKFIQSAFSYGIKSPVGMCLQDAGWKFGPWLKKDYYKPTKYVTWTNYFENIADHSKATDWKFSQEDVQVSLVWGAQVLQKLAQEVRVSENKIIQAEKIAVMKFLENGSEFPVNAFDQAWRTLLLSQHHDCWIVPYNGKPGNTWADKVKSWTSVTNQISDSVIYDEADNTGLSDKAFKVYNTTLNDREEWISVAIPKGWETSKVAVVNENDDLLSSQITKGAGNNNHKLLFKAEVKAGGYNIFYLKNVKRADFAGAKIQKLANGDFLMETDLYKLIVDGKNGGIIKHLIAKKLQNKEFVDQLSDKGFNALQGYFYNKGGYRSTKNSAVQIDVVENGPARISLSVKGKIAGEPFQQMITLNQGQERIDLQLNIDWKTNGGIGAYKEKNYQDTAYRKAFYNDKYKLLAMFPLNLKGQKVFKNAPYDVTESKLKNTFFSSWDSIKNNIILNWVDVVDENSEYGCALYTDHTTSYTHGENFPLGLTIQYSGEGLWGRNYSINGATEIHYSLIPHKGDWREAELWKKGELINEPLLAVPAGNKEPASPQSFFSSDKKGWVLSSSILDGNDLLLRIFNAEGDDTKGSLNLGFQFSGAQLEELNGEIKQTLGIDRKLPNTEIAISIPKFAFRTIRFLNVKP